jgi:hypothetical protein
LGHFPFVLIAGKSQGSQQLSSTIVVICRDVEKIIRDTIFRSKLDTHNKYSSTITQESFSTAMVKGLSYSTINDVLESWEGLKRIENYKEIAGATLFH